MVSGFRFRGSGFRLRVSGFRFGGSGFYFPVSDFRFRGSGVGRPVHGAERLRGCDCWDPRLEDPGLLPRDQLDRVAWYGVWGINRGEHL